MWRFDVDSIGRVSAVCNEWVLVWHRQRSRQFILLHVLTSRQSAQFRLTVISVASYIVSTPRRPLVLDKQQTILDRRDPNGLGNRRHFHYSFTIALYTVTGVGLYNRNVAHIAYGKNSIITELLKADHSAVTCKITKTLPHYNDYGLDLI